MTSLEVWCVVGVEGWSDYFSISTSMALTNELSLQLLDKLHVTLLHYYFRDFISGSGYMPSKHIEEKHTIIDTNSSIS
jgi:hypothetical protein